MLFFFLLFFQRENTPKKKKKRMNEKQKKGNKNMKRLPERAAGAAGGPLAEAKRPRARGGKLRRRRRRRPAAAGRDTYENQCAKVWAPRCVAQSIMAVATALPCFFSMGAPDSSAAWNAAYVSSSTAALSAWSSKRFTLIELAARARGARAAADAVRRRVRESIAGKEKKKEKKRREHEAGLENRR
jgi:hypothetical protein